MLPVDGGVDLSPVVQTICVAVLELTAQATPSIVTVTPLAAVLKPVPVIVTTSPPATGPNTGDTPLTTEVLACEYVTLLLSNCEPALTLTSQV